jgi:branched-chain amino acid transport system substrate-binding protein
MQIFEEAKYKYVFRTSAHLAIDGIGAARYLLTVKPDVKTVAGLNQDYAWGRDSWEVFIRALRKLKPDVQIVDTLWPKLMQGEFSVEISKLLSLRPEIVHSTFWGGDLTALINQGRARGLFDQVTFLFPLAGVSIEDFGRDFPDGIILGLRGPHWFEYPDPKENRLQKEFIDIYRAKYGKYPMPHALYHFVSTLQGLKAAYEKAIKDTGRWPTVDEVIKAFEYLEFDSPSGRISMAIGYGHQAVEPAVYGVTKFDPQLGFSRLDRVQVFPVKCVNPPDGVKTLDWIEQGFPGAQC